MPVTRNQRISQRLNQTSELQFDNQGEANELVANATACHSPEPELGDRTPTPSATNNANAFIDQKPVDCATLGEKNFNVLIAATGSVAAIKLIDLIKKLRSMFPQTFVSTADGMTYKATISIRILMTEHSKHFVSKEQIIESLRESKIQVLDDQEEWIGWKKMGDPVLHIELRKWADVLVIAPLDANTMAKIANGICDNLLTCVVRAWDVSKKLIYCPAMNVHMYNHPITRDQLCKLQAFGYLRVDSIEKRLACGDVGMGAMASIVTIADKVVECLLRPNMTVDSPPQPSLNLQPTYPIISTNNTSSDSTKPVSILDRFRSNSQVTLHAVGGSRVPRLPAISRSAVNRSTSLLQKKPNLVPPMNLAIGRRSSSDDTNGRVSVPPNYVHSGRPNLVTSLQNLKAMNSDFSTLTSDNNEDDDVLDLSTPDDEDQDYNYDDLDPAVMMEQSLITDESIFSGDRSIDGSLTTRMNGSSTSGVALNGMNNYTPVFNSQKFLSLCFDKERQCFTCHICKNDYKNRKSMARHLKEQHVQGNIFQCVSCNVGFKRREKLIKHNRERHGTDQFCKANFTKSKIRQ